MHVHFIPSRNITRLCSKALDVLQWCPTLSSCGLTWQHSCEFPQSSWVCRYCMKYLTHFYRKSIIFKLSLTSIRKYIKSSTKFDYLTKCVHWGHSLSSLNCWEDLALYTHTSSIILIIYCRLVNISMSFISPVFSECFQMGINNTGKKTIQYMSGT